ncbi:hypothetical protein ACFOGJ_17680 [Marinibaculum pumilum]|uniref:Uncharacterized protein n=1 Tax=Marinibaculum pumilum TaxID=1766165 RepID=A0ABV7L339_9PROT
MQARTEQAQAGRRPRPGAISAAAALAFGLCATLALVAGAGPASAAEGDGGAPAAMAQLDTFNKAMRGSYAAARTVLADASRPVILVGGDTVVLMTADGRDRRIYTPPLYHSLKAASHVVLGLTGAMAPALDGVSSGTGWQDALRRIDAEIAALQPHLDQLGLSTEQADRQKKIMARVRTYIAGALPQAAPDRAAFTALMAEIKPLWLADVADAARAQLTTLDGIVDEWRAAMDPADWDRLHVVITGVRAARAGNLQVQYFLRVLKERSPGDRVIYTENLFAPEAAMGLYAATIADRALSDLVFGDTFRMEHDLLGYAAGTILDDILSGAAPR